jgi:MerR family transcriptional regulator, light-induced transcriptional regulator
VARTRDETAGTGGLTYSLGATSRLSGVSPAVMRAWEARYAAVVPERTPGGTRRYRSADIERLRLLKALVAAGRRISEVAQLDVAELRRLTQAIGEPLDPAIEAVFGALDRMDAAETERLLALRLASLGPLRFAIDFAMPLARAIGERWASARTSVAAEHLATSTLRSLLGSALRPPPTPLSGPPLVFATPEYERHELGLLVAALVALSAGAVPIYLGPDLPLDEIAASVASSKATALVLSIVALAPDDAEPALRGLRARLDDAVYIWIGGAGSARLAKLPGVERIESFELLAQRVAALAAPSSEPAQRGAARLRAKAR